jgi:hypothetical protein
MKYCANATREQYSLPLFSVYMFLLSNAQNVRPPIRLKRYKSGLLLTRTASAVSLGEMDFCSKPVRNRSKVQVERQLLSPRWGNSNSHQLE